MPVVVLEKNELAEMLRQAAQFAVSELRADLLKNQYPEVMDKKTLAKYLGRNISYINRKMNDGMPYVGGDREYPRFYRADVDNWLKSR